MSQARQGAHDPCHLEEPYQLVQGLVQSECSFQGDSSAQVGELMYIVMNEGGICRMWLGFAHAPAIAAPRSSDKLVNELLGAN